MSDDINQLKNEEKENLADSGEASQEPDDANHRHRSSGGLVAGIVIIGLGLIFLISNITGYQFNNWWAFFILIPAVASFANAWNAYKEDGRWSKRARGGLLGGTVVMLVAFIFLFNLEWSQMWPFLLILVGIAVLLGAWLDR